LPHKFFIVWRLSFQYLAKSLLFEGGLDAGPDPLDRIVFRAIRNVEDGQDLVLFHKLASLDAMVHAAVVQEESKLGGGAVLEQGKHVLNECVTVNRSWLEEEGLQAAVSGYPGHYRYGWGREQLFL